MVYPYPSRRVAVWCNGVSLTDAVPLVIVKNVYEDNPERDLMTGERPGSPGMRLLYNKRTQLIVRVEFVIREIHDLTARAMALQAVNVWAQDGVLACSNRPDQYLQCVVSQRPALGAVRDYTQLFNVEFTAVSCPYWQAQQADTGTGSGTSGSIEITPAGTVARVPLTFSVSPASGTLTAFSATANGKTMAFSGLSVASTSALQLSYNEHMIQLITASGASAIGKRTAASADDLFLIPGQVNTITWTADVSSSVEFAARGLYE